MSLNWTALDFQEPLDIARQGYAQYLLAAEVRSITESRDLTEQGSGNAEKPPKPLLKIVTSVRYYLFDLREEAAIGEGEIVFNNESPESLPLTYSEFLYSVGRDIAARGVDLMKRSRRNH